MAVEKPKNMTVRQLWEFASRYNMQDAPIVFQDGCIYGINTAKLDVDALYPSLNKIILKDE